MKLVLLLNALLGAAPHQATLIYDANATRCPSKDALVKAVTRRVGSNPFVDSATEQILVQVSRAEDGSLRATVNRLVEGHQAGRRELSSSNADCRELFQALELAVTLAIDPRASPAPSAQPTPVPADAPVQQQAPKAVSWRQSAGPSDTPVERMTSEALRVERLRLETNRPKNGLLFMLIGGGGVLAGTGLNIYNVVYPGVRPSNTPSWVVPAVGTALIVGGLSTFVFGALQRWMNGEALTFFDERTTAIDARLAETEANGTRDPGPPAPSPRSASPVP